MSRNRSARSSLLSFSARYTVRTFRIFVMFVCGVVLAVAFGSASVAGAEESHPCEGESGLGCCACDPELATCRPTTNSAHLECLAAKGACYGVCVMP
jgi:hypothetical protein